MLHLTLIVASLFGTNDGLVNLMIRAALFMLLIGLAILALSRIAPAFYRSLGIGIPGLRVGQDPVKADDDAEDVIVLPRVAPITLIQTIKAESGSSCGCGNEGGCGCGGHGEVEAPLAATLAGKRAILLRAVGSESTN